MSSYFRRERKSNFLWWTLTSAVFFLCSLFIYIIVFYKDFTCLSYSDCLTVEHSRTEHLQATRCQKVCETKECLKLSTRILSNMDIETEPCEDFYQFVCGNYRKKYEGAGNYSTVGSMLENFYSTLKVMIETSKPPEGSAMDKVKIVFDSCMDTGTSDVRAIHDLIEFLHSTGIPEWPRLDSNFTFTKTPLFEVLGKLVSFEQHVFFRFYGSFKDDISTGRLRNLTFSPAVFKQDSEKLTSEDGRNVLMTILFHLGLDKESTQDMTNSFVSIENELIDTLNNASEANCLEEKIVIHCKEENSLSMIMLCNLRESAIRNGMVEMLYEKDRLEMSCDKYYYAKSVHNMVEKYSDRDIANYIALKVFLENLKDLDFSLKLKLGTFLKSEIKGDFSADLNKLKKCIYWLTNNMQYPLGAMYIDNIFPNAASKEVDDLVQKFINATAELFLQQSWVGHAKYKLAEAVSSLKSVFKHTIEDMQNYTEINEMFEMFKPTRSSFITNNLLYQKNRFTQMLTNEKRVRLFIPDGSFEINASGGAEIHLTFGILTRPLFHHAHPDLFNYAGIGFIIGHEIGHNFYLQFEFPILDVTNRTRETYAKKAKCLTDQYSTFKLRKIGKNVQGKLTYPENIADSLGLKTMEIVSDNYMKNAINEDITLPGLSYSPEQLLYIAMGQIWCDVHDAAKENILYSRDIHSPPEYRVIGTLQNSPRFSEVFHCSKTSYMNAEKKCITFE